MENYDDLLNNTPTGEHDAPQLSKEEYAEKKKIEREEVFSLSDATAKDVATDGDKLRAFFDLQARLDRYSAVNALLVFARQPQASRLGDFEHWKRQNCSVKPGQTAISILEPHEYTKDDGTPGTGYNVKKVFDVSQVDARRLQTSKPVNLSERQLLGALVSKAPLTITGTEDLPGDLGAVFDAENKTISVRKGMEFADTFRAVAKELAYADLTSGKTEQTEPHFAAYCTSYLICKKYGVDTKSFSFDDAPSVLKDLDAQSVKGELSQVRNAAESITARMEKQLEDRQRPAKSNDAR